MCMPIYFIPPLFFFQLAEMLARIEAKQRAGYEREPRIKFIIGGNFLEMLDRGVLTLE